MKNCYNNFISEYVMYNTHNINRRPTKSTCPELRTFLLMQSDSGVGVGLNLRGFSEKLTISATSCRKLSVSGGIRVFWFSCFCGVFWFPLTRSLLELELLGIVLLCMFSSFMMCFFSMSIRTFSANVRRNTFLHEDCVQFLPMGLIWLGNPKAWARHNVKEYRKNIHSAGTETLRKRSITKSLIRDPLSATKKNQKSE